MFTPPDRHSRVYIMTMSNIPSFIQKLWFGRLSRDEAERFDKCLQDEDAGLKRDLQNSFEDALLQKEITKQENRAKEETLGKLLAKIENTEDKKGKLVTMVWSSARWAAAVMVLFFIGVQAYHTFQTHDSLQQLPLASRYIMDTPVLRSIKNNTEKKMTITLDDGSVATLLPGSSLRYQEKFNPDERNMQLEGMARFQVAKDTRRPFSVHSGGFTTTALGTTFSMDSRQPGRIEVKLFEGKVVVKSLHNAQRDVYLKPMQYCRAGIYDEQFVVRKFSPDKLPVIIAKNNDLLPAPVLTELNFDNEPLDKVFDKLNTHFHANIRYTRSRMKGLHFTGAILITDSLKSIVTFISRMNGLSLEQQGACLVIH